MDSLTDWMERAAREYGHDLQLEARPTPTSLLNREIALLLSQLDGLRNLHAAQLQQMRQQELDIDTDVLQLQDRTDLSRDVLHRALDRLKQRLLSLALERQKLVAAHYDTVTEVQRQLLRAMTARAQLDF
jgi:hypothetical protein